MLDHGRDRDNLNFDYSVNSTKFSTSAHIFLAILEEHEDKRFKYKNNIVYG